MKDRFGARDDKSCRLRFHTQTAGSTLTAQQPENNIVRVTLQALAAVLGGTQSLHTNSMDEALWLPTEKSVRIALRTQQVIAHESGAADSVDPLGGSYLIEALTDQIEAIAQDYITKIDALGGALQAINSGYMQNEILEAAYTTQRAIEKGEEIVVGVNKFQVQETIELESLTVDPHVEEDQKQRLADLRANRSAEQAQACLTALENAARSDEALMPIFIRCAENDVTLGEICHVLRSVWGQYQPPTFI
jgi:methylmalonyl-CoA mutase, N-terminal domain